jgi:hypothetical protein
LLDHFLVFCVLTGGVFGGYPAGKSGEGVLGGGAPIFGLLGFFE